MSSNLEQGYENSFVSVQMTFVTLDGIFNLKLVMDCKKPWFVCVYLHILQLQTSIHSEALTFLSKTRQVIALSSFIIALIRGGPWMSPPHGT
jgi:hypothetical protein